MLLGLKLHKCKGSISSNQIKAVAIFVFVGVADHL